MKKKKKVNRKPLRHSRDLNPQTLSPELSALSTWPRYPTISRKTWWKMLPRKSRKLNLSSQRNPTRRDSVWKRIIIQSRSISWKSEPLGSRGCVHSWFNYPERNHLGNENRHFCGSWVRARPAMTSRMMVDRVEHTNGTTVYSRSLVRIWAVVGHFPP